MKNFSLFPLIFLVCLTPSNAQTTVCVDPNQGPLPITKPGYALIFQDEFNSLDLVKWDRSTFNNDGPTDCSLGTIPEIGNVSVSGGQLRLDVKKELPNTSLCGYTNAEIKTWHNEECALFRDYRFNPGTYIEMRVQLPRPENGVGSAGWLYGLNSETYVGSGNYYPAIWEIDLWESYDLVEAPGDISPLNEYQTDYHWGESYSNKVHEAKRIKVKNNSNQDVNIYAPGQWWNFAVEWDTDVIKFYLNN